MTGPIFISYSKKDSEFAIKFADDLQASGHKIWIDRSLKVGEKWEQMIERKLEEAQEVIVILSNNAIASRWVQHEGSIAYGLKKKMFPVLIEDIPSENLPLWANKFQYHSFLNIEYQDAFETLNSVLLPPNPFQDILEMQVSTYQQTGALMDESLLNVINENRQALRISAEAEELLTLSLEKTTGQKERLEEMRQALNAANQLSVLGTAIAALQHRINNTFNIIIPNVTRLRSRVDLNDPTVVEILDIIERNARYTSAIISRIQEPLEEVKVTDIDINGLLDTLVLKKRELWKTNLTTPLVNIEFKPDKNIPLIRGSIGQIAEVFDNLTDNAYKAMPKGGEILVESRLNVGEIQVRVTDSGIGIPEDLQRRLFERPVPSRNPGGGSGLGLWLSRLMLQSIGGDIKIENSTKNGTTVLVTIPA